MAVKSNLIPFALIGILAYVDSGCVSMSGSNYVLKTEAQLVAELKAEYPDSFVSRDTINVQDAGKIVGEWEMLQAQYLQIETRGRYGLQKAWEAFTYQYFADGTFTQIVKDHLGVSSVVQGKWSYKKGMLETWILKDNVMQRQDPFRIIWHTDSLIEMRHANIAAAIKRKKIDGASRIKYHYLDIKYETDGCQVTKSDFTMAGTRCQNLNVMAPLILRRVGDAVKPPAVGLQNPIVHDEELKAKMESERQARQREEERNATIALAIAQGANAFSAAMSQPRPTPQPVVVQQIQQSKQDSSTTSAKTSSSTSARPKTFSSKRKCGIHGVEYDLRTGCPQCKAPKFGLDWEVKCPKCGYSHISGKPCPHCN